MKKMKTMIGRTVAGLLLWTTAWAPAWADNTRQAIAQVSDAVTLSDDVDYVITGATPFGDNGVIDIANTDHAVLILSSVKPSAAIKLLAKHVKVNGETAVNDRNCQVKIYNRGAIIMPYSSDFKPLTVYSEPNFGGEECNDFGLENSGGYMNTLSEAKLNNRIRSFKLKRGYMVTFANRAGGKGYSRCFIAADADLEMAELPGVLDRSISSYRVFKWYDTGKVALAAAAGDYGACSALNVTSTYTWSTGSSMHPDVEVVPHQIYSGQPSASSVGSADFSPNMKTSNEPRNTADDHPEDLDAILRNWESLMRTGMRLCTPSSWDGSDYWNGTGFLKTFLDSIDARGWRCDIVDMHCYWAEGNFGNLNNWHIGNRPIWVSEWCWGASWNTNGAFANGVTEANVRDAVQRICNNMNGMDYVERYFYWNGERDPSRLYKNGKLTPAGEMYSKLDGGVGYKKKYSHAPKVPTQKDPGPVSIVYDKLAQTATLSWYEYNGEMNISMFIQRKRGGGTFEDLVEAERKDLAANYTYTVADAMAGDEYRVVIVDANGKQRTTSSVTAVSNNLEAGDPVDVDGVTKYLGGNMVVNGDFDLGFTGWTDLSGNTIGMPWFQIVPINSIDGGSYLQSYANGSSSQPQQFIKTVFDVETNADYYFSGSFANGVRVGGVYLSDDELGTETVNRVFSNSNTDNVWTTNFKTFNTGEKNKVVFYFISLARKAQFDKLMLCRLFDNRDDAIADAINHAKKRAEAFKTYNTKLSALNDELDQNVGTVSASDARSLSAILNYTSQALKALNTSSRIDSLLTVAGQLTSLNLYGLDNLEAAVALANSATTATAIMEAKDALQEAIDSYMKFTAVSQAVPESKFATANKWITKCGTYTGGDQRLNKQENITFWNAWWSGISASEGEAKTMEVKQVITDLPHGYYTLSCKAMTQHYCLSDQHAYLTSGEQTAVSPVLTADYYDLWNDLNMPMSSVWQTLTTTPVYVDEGGSVTIGFVGSKAGAVDNAWHQIGGRNGNSPADDVSDKREGWWGATDFVLNRAPGYQRDVAPGEYGVICLPYALKPVAGMHFFGIGGITADHENLCLYELDEVDQAKPVIFMSDNAKAIFSGSGANRSVPRSDDFLQGNFTATSRPAGCYMLINGAWQRLSERTALEAYSANLKAEVVANMPEYTEWNDGPLIPIVGADIDFANAIELPAQTAVAIDGIYTVDGRRVAAGQQLQGGLYIKVANGIARKVIIQ